MQTKEEKAAWRKAYYQTHKERIHEVGRQWRHANAEKVKKKAAIRRASPERQAYQKAYWQKNKERGHAQSLIYRTKNAEKLKANGAAKRAFKKEAVQFYVKWHDKIQNLIDRGLIKTEMLEPQPMEVGGLRDFVQRIDKIESLKPLPDEDLDTMADRFLDKIG